MTVPTEHDIPITQRARSDGRGDDRRPQDADLQLEKLRPGQLVTISGYLVDVRDPGGFRWSTSMSRSDTGDGACELVWVESLAVE